MVDELSVKRMIKAKNGLLVALKSRSNELTKVAICAMAGHGLRIMIPAP